MCIYGKWVGGLFECYLHGWGYRKNRWILSLLLVIYPSSGQVRHVRCR